MPAPTALPPVNGYDIEPGLVYVGHGPEPDWAALYPVRTCHPTSPTAEQSRASFNGECCDEEGSPCYVCTWEMCDACHGGSPLTPRMAFVLHTSAVVCADQLRTCLATRIDDTTDLAARVDLTGDVYWADVLPRVAHQQVTRGWAERFIACFQTIAGRLAAGRGLSANCTGEEAAIHELLYYAGDLYGDGCFHDVWEDELEALPEGGSDDEDFERLRELCLEDEDVLWLYDAALDGIESDTELAARLGTANLHPSAWFLPFRDVAPAA